MREASWVPVHDPRAGTYAEKNPNWGFVLHCVEFVPLEEWQTAHREPSACGVRPRHGWAVDPFVEKKCARCLRRRGLACEACRGLGHVTGRHCFRCAGTGETGKPKGEPSDG